MAIIVTEDYAYQYWLDKAKAYRAPERYIAEIEKRRDESASKGTLLSESMRVDEGKKVRKEIFI